MFIFQETLLDLLGAAQTFDSHEAVKEFLNLTSSNHNTDNAERYFQALAVSTRANEIVMNDLIALHSSTNLSNKVKWTLINALGSIAYRFAHSPNQNYSSKSVQNVEQLLLNSLSKCKDDSSCFESYLNGLQNLQSNETIDTLFTHVDNRIRTVALAAIKALKTFPKHLWTSEHVKHFEHIFYQTAKKYDSSIRTLALDVLLQLNLNKIQITKLVKHLKSDDKSYEVKKYLLEEVRMIAEQKDTFRLIINEIIRKDKTLNNYHIIGQKGLSTALSRTYSIHSPYNATLTSIQETNSGILKRGIVDLTINTPEDSYTIFGVDNFVISLFFFFYFFN